MMSWNVHETWTWTATRARWWRQLNSEARLRLRQRKVYGPFSLVINGRAYDYLGDDRSEVVWGVGAAFRDAGAAPHEALAAVMETPFWKARARDGKREDPHRFIERVYGRQDLERSSVDADGPQPEQLLHAVDPSEWDGLPVPERQWRVPNLVPDRKVTLLSGDGGAGKTTLVSMLAVACAVGRDFLDIPVAPCRVFAFLGENDETDTRIALDAICRHYGVAFADLKGRLLVASRAGLDNIMMTFDKSPGRRSALAEELIRQVRKFGPGLVVLETAADLFGGNENDRSEVRRFVVDFCERIARECGCAVVLCAHPSVSGITSGHGYSGSTAWNASARSRLYLRRDIDKNGKEELPDSRILEVKKANFGPTGQSFDLIWRDGVFVVNDPRKQRAGLADTDERIVREVERAFDRGVPWSAHPQAKFRYLGNWLRDQLKLSRRAGEANIARLLEEGRLREVEFDRHSHRKGLATPEQAAKLARRDEPK